MKKIVSIILVTFMTLSVSADSGKKFVCSNQDVVVSGVLYHKDNLAPVSSSSYFDRGANYSEESFITIDFKKSHLHSRFLASRYSFIGMSDGFGNYTIQVLGIKDRTKEYGVDFYDALILDIDHEDKLSVIIPGTKNTKKQVYKIDYRKDLSCQTALFNLY